MFEGKNVYEIFKNESGGHRWQRVPPTEKRGRVQTSTVTVSVFESKRIQGDLFKTSDVKYTATVGSGPGGQHRNKTASCITATHIPTGINVKIDQKSQHQSKAVATQVLNIRVNEHYESISNGKQNNSRKDQIGSGMRGDKVRTYREKDDLVVDHRTNKKKKLSKWIKGIW